jgi:glycosyltransferase involved in cell wall biosynthesis
VAGVAGRLETVVNEPRRLRRAPSTPAPASDEPLPPPVAPAHRFVFFQVAHHAWGEGLNQQRAAVIRALRAGLGDRFVGGMTFTGDPVPGYEDCASGFLPDHRAYLALVRDAAVVVSTNGFGGSPPWKLAEYLEAGACIVSEPQEVALPAAQEHDRHLWLASTPDEVVDACRRLLDDPAHRARLADGAAAYHAAVVEPTALARRVLAGTETSCPA